MKTLLLISAILLSFSQIGSADILAGWDFSSLNGGANNFGASPLAASQTALNLMVGGLTRGSGIGTTGTGAARAWGANAWDGSTDSSTAISASKFVTFSLTADAGSQMSISSIDAFNVRRSGTGPTTGQLQYQIGGDSFVDIGSSITWGAITTSAGNPQVPIDLTGILALQNIAGGTSVTFRIVSFGATSSTGTWYLNEGSTATPGVNDFAISGSVSPVPEPGTVALVGLGLGAVLYGVRRRRA